ncbi:MAG TPA: AI-2E family transporter, partial [Blastocatellia bacterium]|nr:AI-2E family transporter [Blastocatellia bacterium]
STTASQQVGAPSLRQPAQRKAAPSSEHPLLVQLVEPPSTLLQSLSAIISPVLAPIATAIIVLVFAIAMLLKREDLRNRFLRLIGKTQLNLATQAIDDATQRVSRYLRTQFLVNAAFGILITAGLYFIGVPNAVLWGVLAGVFRFVPFVGAIVGASLPLMLALALFDNWQQPMMVLGLFLFVEPTVAYVVEPWLYGTHTGISSLAILVSAAFWTTLWGPIGLILSMPLTVCLVVIGRHVPHLEFLHVVLGDEEVLSAAAQFYQRLLALDQLEARAVIDAFLKDHLLIQLYDDVMIPALSMAEEDRHKGALDETRERFFLQSIEEFVDELADVGAEQASNAQQRPDAESNTALIPPNQEIRVVCIPANDKADEMSGAMLAQVLDLAGFTTASFSVLRSPAEVIEALSGHQGDIVCISAVPPFALLNARALSKQLRARFPQLRIVVGLWSFSKEDGVRVDDRLSKAFTVEVVTTLAQVIESIRPSPDSTTSLEPSV